MYESIDDLDKAGECVRNILDNIKCGICDNFGRIFRRCLHGHIVCGDCSVEESCPSCATTFNSPVLNNTWVTDELQSQKVEHALDLLNTFQDTFKTDVYRRQRISEQLKVEKELFPDCIQAPAKYSNKRKTLKSYSSIFDKENNQHSFLPGESISPLHTPNMEKSKYVQRWLESSTKSASRKPFANINVNNQRVSDLNLSVSENKSIRKSRTVNKMSLTKKQPLRKSAGKKGSFTILKKTSVEHLSKTPKKDIKTASLTTNIINNLQLDNTNKFNDDSGIAMDEECITIDDSQTEIVDKDALALQAVHDTERNIFSGDSTYNDVDTQYKSNVYDFTKVRFVKKSWLYKSCPNCNILRVSSTNQIAITVEYSSKVELNVNKQSVSVQTDIIGIDRISKPVTGSETLLFSSKNILKDNINIKSQDLFTDDINMVNTHVQNDEITFCQNKENVIIDDSDTDVEAVELLQVAAQVHRSCDQKDYDILSALAMNEIKNRKRRAVRGVTPGSTDSSDKENLDPNRMKRSKCTKKGKKKPNKG